MSNAGSTRGGFKEEVVTTKSLKIATPTPFNGERKKLDTFLLQMMVFFKFNDKLFAFESEKVMCASYYLQGDAKAWFRPYLKDFMDNTNAPTEADDETVRVFSGFDKFMHEIRLVFGDIDGERTAERDIDEQRTAEREIRQLKQTKSAADYTDQFKRISAATNWNEAAVMAHYYQGLKDGVKDEIAREERPDTLRDMTIMAVRIDKRLYERQLEKGQLPYREDKKGPSTKHKHRHHHKHDKYGPKPMEVDVIETQRKAFSGNCYNCGKRGHFARNCR
ncbi:Zinc finger, CCHC-type [Lasallia pustulata]|uniref:Zinc finger, CCHC-type n=1 Tax=Lasallia pustulata TaxID=136370 RepID=A0A1W5D2G3_9LECA|nr:Zinc finger, CCHC-type [Lasallia pustulata]